jgi:hypothetical protein
MKPRIERGLPIPSRGGGNYTRKFHFERLKVGDSEMRAAAPLLLER